MTQIGNIATAKHLFEIGTSNEQSAEGKKIEVFANTRAQAAAIAKKAGYVVRDVNMIG